MLPQMEYGGLYDTINTSTTRLSTLPSTTNISKARRATGVRHHHDWRVDLPEQHERRVREFNGGDADRAVDLLQGYECNHRH